MATHSNQDDRLRARREHVRERQKVMTKEATLWPHRQTTQFPMANSTRRDLRGLNHIQH